VVACYATTYKIPLYGMETQDPPPNLLNQKLQGGGPASIS
jgi:hypothetical protein